MAILGLQLTEKNSEQHKCEELEFATNYGQAINTKQSYIFRP